MKTLIATATLTVMFLSAGAFAGNNHPRHGVHNANLTVISKNQSWPVAGMITVEACNLARCIEI